MMNKNKTEMIIDLFQFYSAPINKKQIEMWVHQLKDFSDEEVSAAIKKAISNNMTNFVPNPAKIIDYMFNFPDPEEAWGWMVPKSEDDHGIFCDEIAVAFGACRHLLAEGNHIGARLAFISAYQSEIENSKSLKKKPKFVPTRGFRKSGLEEIMNRAISRGFMTAKDASKFCPELAISYDQLRLEAPKEQITPEYGNKKIEELWSVIGKIKKVPKE